MNLLTKTTLIYVVIIFAVFSFGSVLSFKIFQKEVNIETDYHLLGQLNFIKEVIERGAPVHSLNYNKLQIQRIDSTGPMKTNPSFSDTMVVHGHLKRLAPHRKLSINAKVRDTWYHISLFESVLEEDDITDSVTTSLSYTFSILLVLLLVSTVIISSWIFQPFKKTLKAVNAFNLKDEKIPNLGRTPIKEFTQLNEILYRMMRKSRRDFLNLKEFIENASHEIQTPLAIARGKLELLMESEGLNENQAQLIHSSYNSLTKMSQLNRSLGLLSKIDNQEFSNAKPVDLSEVIHTKLQDFEELLELKELNLETSIQPGVGVVIDPMLLDILISNLLNNSIKHNFVRGKIHLTLEPGKLLIQNTGKPLLDSGEFMFQRFRKGKDSPESHGLGLAIVKKVCDVSKMDISYKNLGELHEITLIFQSANIPKEKGVLIEY